MHRFPATFAAVVVALAALAACGSSAKPLSQADYIAQADAICTQTNKDIVAATKGQKNSTSDQVVAATKTEIVPLLKRQADELAKLKPPAAQKAAVKKFTTQMKAVVADIDDNTAAFVKARGVSALATAAAILARDIGLRVCAKIGTS